ARRYAFSRAELKIAKPAASPRNWIKYTTQETRMSVGTPHRTQPDTMAAPPTAVKAPTTTAARLAVFGINTPYMVTIINQTRMLVEMKYVPRGNTVGTGPKPTSRTSGTAQ